MYCTKRTENTYHQETHYYPSAQAVSTFPKSIRCSCCLDLCLGNSFPIQETEDCSAEREKAEGDNGDDMTPLPTPAQNLKSLPCFSAFLRESAPAVLITSICV